MGAEQGFRLRQVRRIITRAQKHGICDGDRCPRCGRNTMSSDNRRNSYIPELNGYICKECEMERALSIFTLNKADHYDNWVLYGEVESNPEHNTKKIHSSNRSIVCAYKEGDRVIDAKGDWPGTIVHTLPAGGLYEVMPDGVENNDTVILKDRELTLEMSGDFLEYVNLVKSRFFTGMELVIEQISSSVGDIHAGMKAEIVTISENGGLQIEFENGDKSEIYPDCDRFQVLGDKIEEHDCNNDTLADIPSIEF